MNDQDLVSSIARLEAIEGFSGAIQVAIDGTVVFASAFGLAERSHHVANTMETRFGLASGTKFPTALGIGALIDDGRLQLSSRVRDLVTADLPNVDAGVTIDHLLTHTSGVYDFLDEDVVTDQDAFELPIPGFKLLTPRDYLPLLTAGPQKFAPGTRFSYSNGGFVLLGLVIQELTGSFHDFIHDRVLARCGMKHSGFFRFDELPANVATGYLPSGRANIYVLPIIGAPDGGMFSTVGDIHLLWREFFACLASQRDGSTEEPSVPTAAGRGGETSRMGSAAPLQTDSLLSRELAPLFVRKAAREDEHFFYGRGLWIQDDGVEPPRLSIVGEDAGVSFRSHCYSENTIATVVSNVSGGAQNVTKEIDRLIKEKVPRGQRGFRFPIE